MYAETEVQHRSYHCYSGNCKSVLYEYQKVCTFYGYILYYVFCLYDTYFSDLFYRKMASATDGNYYLYDCISFAGNDRYSDSAKHGVYIGYGKKPTGRAEPSVAYDRCISGIIFNTDRSMGTKIGKICDADKKNPAGTVVIRNTVYYDFDLYDRMPAGTFKGRLYDCNLSVCGNV